MFIVSIAHFELKVYILNLDYISKSICPGPVPSYTNTSEVLIGVDYVMLILTFSTYQ